MSQIIEFYAYLNGINKSKMVEFPDSASLFDISKEFDKWLDNYFYAQIRKLDGDDDTLDVVTKYGKKNSDMCLWILDSLLTMIDLKK